MARKYVLDTHALVWFLEGNPRLGSGARLVLEDLQSELILPLIALAEAAFMVERGRTSISSVTAFLERLQEDGRIEVQPITIEVFQASLKAKVIPEMHDRLIVGTALALRAQGHSVSLLTKDEMIKAAHLIGIIW